MSFLSPWFLVGAAAAAVPIVLHLLKREPEPRIRFAAVKFLLHATVAYTERRRIHELVLLALRVSALMLLAVAFARPFLASGAAAVGAGATVIVLDTSASMSAPGTFARARELARAAVNRAPAGNLVGVVTFDDIPRVAAEPRADRGLALAAIETAAPGFGATRYAGALGAAVAALEGRRGTIVVVTDLQERGWDAGPSASIPDSDRLEIADVGAPPPNLAVTAVRADGERIVAVVSNSGEQAREAQVHLAFDGRPAGEATVTVGPRGSADVPFGRAANVRDAAVSVDDSTGSQSDNVRYLVVGEADRPTVLIVTGSGALERDAFYVQQALLADAFGRQTYRVAGVSGAQLSTWDVSRLSANVAVILLSTRGLERRGREVLAASVRSGAGLLIAAGPGVDGEVVGDVLGRDAPLRVVTGNDPKAMERALVPVDSRHPLFQRFGPGAPSLGLVRFRRVSQIDGAGCRALARFTTGEPALLECAVGAGRALVFASDLDVAWNDFPLRPSFVPFLHEAMKVLGGTRLRGAEYLMASRPSGVPAVPGIMTVEPASPGQAPKRVAANVDPREIDPARVSADEFQKAVARVKGAGAGEAPAGSRQQEDGQQLWRHILALMIGVLAVEGVVASRTA